MTTPAYKNVRFSPAWAPDSVKQVTGLIHLNKWLEDHLPSQSGMRMVELGSLTGESASIFAAFPIWSSIVCVDIWAVEPVFTLFKSRLADDIATGRVAFHRMLSALAGDDEHFSSVCPGGPPHFVYIDACHDYEAVALDLRIWYPRLAAGGVIGGHDYSAASWPGVKRAVDEFKAEHELTIARFEDGSYILHKP